MEYETTQPRVDMVATLQSRKDSLEAKLKEKNEELKALCIQEAELTGVLPPETPLEAGESPPVFRRRVGTAFTYPENLINKLKSKEEESLATLELEYNIQVGIAEAARSLAGDPTTNKGARRKHRLVYQQSQRRLLELEARLNLLRQAANSRCPLKQRKKPRPPLESEVDGGMGGDMNVGISLSPVQEKMYQMSQQPIQTQGVPTHHGQLSAHSRGRHQPPTMPLHSYNHNPHRPVHSEVPYNGNWMYQQQHQHQQHVREVERHQHHRNTNSHEQQANRYRESVNWYNTAPTSRYLGVGTKPDDEEREKAARYRDRFGSLDRRRGSSSVDSQSGEPELRHSPVHRLYSHRSSPTHAHPALSPTSSVSVLLPNQTYPENSLMRTHSLGTVDHSSRKSKEKDWFETSLDARPSPTPPPLAHTPTPAHPHAHTPTQPHPPPPLSHTSGSEADPSEQIHMPVTQQLSFETVVPVESPKNHTVVQAGMWQPYREVTKPFEMADFYKYSTKFRKNTAPGASAPTPQQKAAYQPLQPMTCQPLATQDPASEGVSSPGAPQPSVSDAFSHEMLSWYQDQNAPQPRSATLV